MPFIKGQNINFNISRLQSLFYRHSVCNVYKHFKLICSNELSSLLIRLDEFKPSNRLAIRSHLFNVYIVRYNCMLFSNDYFSSLWFYLPVSYFSAIYHSRIERPSPTFAFLKPVFFIVRKVFSFSVTPGVLVTLIPCFW